MPELPEVETIKRQLNHVLMNKKIQDTSVYTDKMVYLGVGKVPNLKKGSKKQSIAFIDSVRGKKIAEVQRRAKYLIIRFSDNCALIIHLRMSGQLIFINKKELSKPIKLSMASSAVAQLLPIKHTHVEMTFTDGSKLFYNDTRQFGHLRFAEKEEVEKILGGQGLGPEPLELKKSDFAKIVHANPKRVVKDFLLDQSIIAGIGNIYADEALFISKIRPDRRMQALSDDEISKLHSAIQKVLKKAIKAGGSSLEYFLMTNGDSGKFVEAHQVYGRSKENCFECGELLITSKIAGRTTVFCQYCQK